MDNNKLSCYKTDYWDTDCQYCLYVKECRPKEKLDFDPNFEKKIKKLFEKIKNYQYGVPKKG